MKMERRLVGAVSGLMLSIVLSGAAHAGGLEANGYDWDLLFDPAHYATKASLTYVHINHEVSNTGFYPDGRTVSSSGDKIYYNFGIKADLGDNARCLVSAQNPWGAKTERDLVYAAVNAQAASETLTSLDAGLTCAYGVPMGPGVISVIGGVSAQMVDYDADLPVSPVATMPLSVNGWGVGWRAGLVYEIEEYALRVSGIYNAPIEYDLDGTFLGAPATANETTPQSVEVNVQTGIAPGWLALASVKWVDWSVLQSLDVDTIAGTVSSDLSYRDGWVLSAGIGHALTDDLSVLGAVTWDQGTSTPGGGGVLVSGSQTDRWGVALGGLYDASESVQISGGVSLSALASGTNAAGESWDTGYVLAFNGGIKGSF